MSNEEFAVEPQGMHAKLDAEWEEQRALALKDSGKVTPIRKARGDRKQNAKAAKAEALNDGVEFEFEGKTYELEPAMEWDIEVMEYFGDNELLKGVRLLLGDKQFAEFKTDLDGNKVKRTMQDLADFLELAMAQLGVASAE